MTDRQIPGPKHAADERGGIVVLFALLLPALILVLAFAIDIGNWFVHKRHLQMQADAAALAGGAHFGDCFDPAKAGSANDMIKNAATMYAGNAASTYNLQVGGGSPRVTTLFNSKTFFIGGPPADDTDIEEPCQTPHLMLDVKQTEADVPYILGSLIDWVSPGSGTLVPAINARARVQLRKATIVKGSLPLAIPDIDPRHVAVTFVNEATGARLAGPFDLAAGVTVGGINVFSGSGSVTIPSTSSTDGVKVGVRVGIGGQLGTCDAAAGTGGAGFTCYDYGDSSIGLVAIHGDGANGTNTRPAPRVWTSTQCSSSGSPFFSERDVVSPATSCTAAVFAVMQSSGVLDNSDPKNVFTATINGATKPLTYSSADGYWSSGYVFDVPVDSGAFGVSLHWKYQGKGSFQDYNNVQRVYSASGDSGPIKIVKLGEASGAVGSPYAVAPGTHTFTIDVGIAGKLSLSAPTETVLLRLTGGSRTTAIACDGPGAKDFRDAIVGGCKTPYQINAAGYCPDPSPPPGPATCVPLKTGEMAGPTERALDDRFASCPPINWNTPSFDPENDPRVVKLIITDFSVFNESGSVDVPVTNFAAFYITGWTGSKCKNNDPPPFDVKKGGIWGHFFKYVAPDPYSGGTEVCDPLAITPCIPVLVK
jgi:Putative Flp pilus-assembly TadE/G-like